ncbi:MAG: hypothetical protein KDD44_07940, partial [Bdellovibrionales bacterium]|nr:hypothetical protein [Bdellovibrionales bacterium]
LQPDKMLILYDPFMPIPEQHREVFAMRLLDFAWNGQAIVVVVHLEYRPESWIDNQLVSRIQVDEKRRRKTVGFGSMPTDIQSAVRQVRQAVGGRPAPEQGTVVQTTSSKYRMPTVGAIAESQSAPQSEPRLPTTADDALRRRRMMRGSIPILALVAGFLAFISGGEKPAPGPYAAQTPVEVRTSASGASEAERVEEVLETPAAVSDAPEVPESPLSKYPLPVQQAVTKAFEGEVSSPELTPIKVIGQPVKPRVSEPEAVATNAQLPPMFGAGGAAGGRANGAADLLAALRARAQEARERGDLPVQELDPEAEARREEIRQRFIEAIRNSVQRAAE